jgi:hypothetical protein
MSFTVRNTEYAVVQKQTTKKALVKVLIIYIIIDRGGCSNG